MLIQGYANAYSQYVTTPEEYQLQQYEGGSTLFGKYTLPAYQQEFAGLAKALKAGTPVAAGTHPPKPATAELNLQTGVVFDSPPPFKSFGQVLTDAAPAYQLNQTVTVEFVTGHPKNNLHRNGTFLEVQKLTWGPMATSCRRRRLGHDVPLGADRLGGLEGDDHLEGRRAGHLPDRPPRRLEGAQRHHHPVHRDLTDLQRVVDGLFDSGGDSRAQCRWLSTADRRS